MKKKTDRVTRTILFAVFLWILLWNIIVQALHGALATLPFSSWAFFIAATFLFLLEGHDMKKKFLQTLVGGAVGIIFAALTMLCYAWLMGMGAPHLIAIGVPLIIVLGLLIVVAPDFPIFFNNVGFGYFIVALISPESAVSAAPSYLLSLVLGCLILNGGCIFIITRLTKYYTKKLTAKAAAEKERQA